MIIIEIPGKKKMLEHLPDRSTHVLKLYLIYVILVLLSTLCVLFIIDIIPRFFPSINWLTSLEPFMPFIGSFIAVLGGLSIVHVVWRKRNEFIAKDEKTAYQKSLNYSLTGIPILVGGFIHAYMPISWLAARIFSLDEPQNPLTNLFERSVGQVIADTIGNPEYRDLIPRIIFSILFLILAWITIIRTIFVFGMDNASMLYLYYPEESKLVDHKIYSIVRHPLYVGVLILSVSAMISNFSIYSIGIFLIFLICFNYHIFGVEEKELIQRFGDGFREYRKKTPALIIKPKNWGRYFKFLIGKTF